MTPHELRALARRLRVLMEQLRKGDLAAQLVAASLSLEVHRLREKAESMTLRPDVGELPYVVEDAHV